MINNDFPRILTLLRKEQGFSQKKVAEDLGISQALLSHYEKGIRECGLNFVIKAADYYGVSCDYLLGRSPHRSGKKFTLDDVPDDNAAQAPKSDSSQLEYNRRILVNSINIVFAILKKIKSESLTDVVSHYLFSAVYKAFRVLYSSNPKNPQGMFELDRRLFGATIESSMAVSEAKGRYILGGEDIGECKGVSRDSLPHLTPELLTNEYPLYAPSLFDMIKKLETDIKSEK